MSEQNYMEEIKFVINLMKIVSKITIICPFSKKVRYIKSSESTVHRNELKFTISYYFFFKENIDIINNYKLKSRTHFSYENAKICDYQCDYINYTGNKLYISVIPFNKDVNQGVKIFGYTAKDKYHDIPVKNKKFYLSLKKIQKLYENLEKIELLK